MYFKQFLHDETGCASYFLASRQTREAAVVVAVRGELDVVVANQRGPLLIYKNSTPPENAWVDFELTGTMANRDAIGAQVRLFWNGQEQLQEVSGGAGYSAQNQRKLHFGLGRSPRVEKAVIRWPSGVEQVLEGPAVGRVHSITEPK